MRVVRSHLLSKVSLSFPLRHANCIRFVIVTGINGLLETETIVVFACGHIYHVSHLHGPSTPEEQDTPQGQDPASLRLHYQPSSIQSSALSRTVGLKVTNARLLRDKIGDGCRICADSLKDTAQQ